MRTLKQRKDVAKADLKRNNERVWYNPKFKALVAAKAFEDIVSQTQKMIKMQKGEISDLTREKELLVERIKVATEITDEHREFMGTIKKIDRRLQQLGIHLEADNSLGSLLELLEGELKRLYQLGNWKELTALAKDLRFESFLQTAFTEVASDKLQLLLKEAYKAGRFGQRKEKAVYDVMDREQDIHKEATDIMNFGKNSIDDEIAELREVNPLSNPDPATQKSHKQIIT